MILITDLVPQPTSRARFTNGRLGGTAKRMGRGTMTRRDIGCAAFGIFVILCATAFGLLGGFGIKEIAILSIGGGSVFYATMWLIDRPPT